MEKFTPLASVLILNYRSAWQAVECARSFLQQTIADQLEIIVIDNHSDDDSIGILRNSLGNEERVQIVETPRNAGFGKGYNTGASYASGKYLFINNPVKRLPDDGLERLIAKMEQDPSIGIIAPELQYPDGSCRPSARHFPTPLDVIVKRTMLQKIFPAFLKKYLMLDANPKEQREVDWIAGGCFLMKRELFDQLKGFDDRFFLFFEDTDLCKRVQQAGKTVVYCPEVSGTDRQSRLSDGGLWKLLTTKVGRIHIVSACKYFWKWGFPRNS